MEGANRDCDVIVRKELIFVQCVRDEFGNDLVPSAETYFVLVDHTVAPQPESDDRLLKIDCEDTQDSRASNHEFTFSTVSGSPIKLMWGRMLRNERDVRERRVARKTPRVTTPSIENVRKFGGESVRLVLRRVSDSGVGCTLAITRCFNDGSHSSMANNS